MKTVWLSTLGLALASAAVWPWWGSGTLAQAWVGLVAFCG